MGEIIYLIKLMYVAGGATGLTIALLDTYPISRISNLICGKCANFWICFFLMGTVYLYGLTHIHLLLSTCFLSYWFYIYANKITFIR